MELWGFEQNILGTREALLQVVNPTPHTGAVEDLFLSGYRYLVLTNDCTPAREDGGAPRCNVGQHTLNNPAELSRYTGQFATVSQLTSTHNYAGSFPGQTLFRLDTPGALHDALVLREATVTGTCPSTTATENRLRMSDPMAIALRYFNEITHLENPDIQSPTHCRPSILTTSTQRTASESVVVPFQTNNQNGSVSHARVLAGLNGLERVLNAIVAARGSNPTAPTWSESAERQMFLDIAARVSEADIQTLRDQIASLRTANPVSPPQVVHPDIGVGQTLFLGGLFHIAGVIGRGLEHLLGEAAFNLAARAARRWGAEATIATGLVIAGRFLRGGGGPPPPPPPPSDGGGPANILERRSANSGAREIDFDTTSRIVADPVAGVPADASIDPNSFEANTPVIPDAEFVRTHGVAPRVRSTPSTTSTSVTDVTMLGDELGMTEFDRGIIAVAGGVLTVAAFMTGVGEVGVIVTGLRVAVSALRLAPTVAPVAAYAMSRAR